MTHYLNCLKLNKVKRDIHYTDVMYEIYKRHKKLGILLDMYSHSAKHSPLSPQVCSQCDAKIKGPHVISETSARMCDKCYQSIVVRYYELGDILSKFKYQGGDKK